MAVEVGNAPVIMQLKFQQSFSFIFQEVPQIQFNSRVPHLPVVCRGVVVGVPVNCSDISSSSTSAWTNCAENRRVFCTFLRNAWLTMDTCSATAPWCSRTFCPHFLRERGYSDPEVHSRPALLVSSFYAEWRGVHIRCFGFFPWFTWKSGHYFFEPRTWQSLARCLCIAVEKFLSCVRLKGWRGRREFRLLNDLPSTGLWTGVAFRVV